MSHSNSDPDLMIIESLEKEFYMTKQFTEPLCDNVKSKIEEFSSWFNSVARLYFLRCHPEDSETLIYLLLNLKKKIKFAISEINRSVSSTQKSFTCSVCSEKIEVNPWQNVWSVLQEHPHFEEVYSQFDDNSTSSEIYENGESPSNESFSIDELLRKINELNLNKVSDDKKPNFKSLDAINQPQNGLNDFKFNFLITYDERIEEALYPEPLVLAARRKDQVAEYTVQRCGVGRGVCLLCTCNLISKGRTSKISPFIIKNHASGQRHLKNATSPIRVNALRQYHDFWRSQDSCIQAHQVHFMPETTAPNYLKCHLCQDFVNYTAVLKHIRDTQHKNRVLKFFNLVDGKPNEIYLLDLQVEIYEEVKNLKKEKVKEGTMANQENVTPDSCVIIKADLEINGIHLPPRYKDHVQFFNLNSNRITCRICGENFSNVLEEIANHIYKIEHKEKSELPYPRYKFYCEICNWGAKDETGWKEHLTKGPNRHNNIAESRKLKLTEYECKSCLLVIYGDDLSISRHLTRNGKSGKNKDIKLPFYVKKYFKSRKFIDGEARRLQLEAASVLDNQTEMRECLKSLEEGIALIFPNCRAYPFGSRISGLGNNKSDLDVFVDIGNMYYGEVNQDSESQEQFVKKVGKLLKSRNDFSSVVSIPSARTPIVKVQHNLTNMECDISFRHGLGVENTKFLQFCINLQPITQPFILLLKKWSNFCKLNEHITNYALALMAIFFLQVHGYLLPVKTVRSYNPTKSVIIDGWETIKYTVPTEHLKQHVKLYVADIKDLLRNFFFYFAKFDYANLVICPLLGETIPKMWFNENPQEKLPNEMRNYLERIRQDHGEQFRSLVPFCIQDPFDLSHNLAKACHHSTVTRLKTYCNLTYEYFDLLD